MQETSLAAIHDKALELHAAGSAWHFHILTPSCRFNERDSYAFILEDVARHTAWVHYSEQAEKELGGQLSPLLHGAATVESPEEPDDLPTDSQKIVERAQSLSNRGIGWHHHVLFPGCNFNNVASKYTLVLEDPETKEVLTSSSDTEPKAELTVLEPLFYSQLTD